MCTWIEINMCNIDKWKEFQVAFYIFLERKERGEKGRITLESSI